MKSHWSTWPGSTYCNQLASFKVVLQKMFFLHFLGFGIIISLYWVRVKKLLSNDKKSLQIKLRFLKLSLRYKTSYLVKL